MKKIILLILGSSIFGVFIFFSFLAHKDIFTNFDFNTTVRLQDHISRRFDDFFSFLSVAGSFEIAGLFLLGVLVLIRKLRGIIVLFAFGLMHVFELFGKTFVEHLPPPHFMLRTNKLVDFPQFYVRSEFSYPSGHAARAAFISIILTFFILRFKKISWEIKIFLFAIIFLYDLLMLTSRVYLGEHWSSDVIGGTILGLSLSLLSMVVF